MMGHLETAVFCFFLRSNQSCFEYSDLTVLLWFEPIIDRSLLFRVQIYCWCAFKILYPLLIELTWYYRPLSFASSNSLSTSETQTMIIEVLLLVVLLGALLYRLLSISASQWSPIDGVMKGRNNHIHWKLSANLLGGLQKALISGNAWVFLTTSLHSLTEVTTSSMVSVNFLMITSFSSPSHCFYHIPNDKTTLHANVPINATHNLMVRMQGS